MVFIGGQEDVDPQKNLIRLNYKAGHPGLEVEPHEYYSYQF